TQWNTESSVGAYQAVTTHRNDFRTATGKGAHGAAAAAQVTAGADRHPGGNATFHHGGSFCTGIEVDKAFVHHGGAFAQIGTQTHTCGVGNAHTARHYVVAHLG